jgi:hypothetical protein
MARWLYHVDTANVLTKLDTLDTMKAKSASAKSAAPSVTLSEGDTVNPPVQAITLESALAFIATHYKLASPSQASKALHAARAVSIAAAEQGSENARLPILSETAKHGTNAKDKTGKEMGTITRSVASLDADKLKARRSRERILNAAVLLGMASGKAL